jgi:RNA polymerase sigma-70 factor (ECF subfamily)
MESSSPDNPSPEKLSLTDAELLHALKSKQAWALGILYDRYGGLVYGIGLKVLQNPQEAEDLTQEIFLALWRNATINLNTSSLLPYLVKMTRSRAIDKLRVRSRNINLLQRIGQTFTAESPTSTPFEAASLTERSKYVRDALAQLPEQQRQVIEMAYDQGLSQSKIAQQLNKPLGTVKTLTRQGLLTLKQILKGYIDW